MAIITDERRSILFMRTGVESLQKDVVTISDYRKSLMGTGLNSLDYPAGRLIASGLHASYPDHFKLGGGLEDLDGLIETLEGATSAGEDLVNDIDKTIETVEKVSTDIVEEVKETYTSQEWIDEHKFELGKTSVPALAKLVAGNNLDEVSGNVPPIIKAFETALKTATSSITSYWGKVSGKVESIKGEEDKEKRDELIKELNDLADDLPKDAIMPVIGSGADSNYQGLNKKNIADAGELIITLVEGADGLLEITKPAFECGLDESVEGVKDNLVSKESLLKDLKKLTEDARTYLVDIAAAIEEWIAESSKEDQGEPPEKKDDKEDKKDDE